MKEVLLLTVLCVVCFVVGFTAGTGNSTIRMSRQSLEGYKGHAIYKTNSVGEVTIDKLSWEKK